MSTLADELERLTTDWPMADAFRVDRVQLVEIIAALRSTDALAVQREPTPKMLFAAAEAETGMLHSGFRLLWQTMWDAAQGTRSKP